MLLFKPQLAIFNLGKVVQFGLVISDELLALFRGFNLQCDFLMGTRRLQIAIAIFMRYIILYSPPALQFDQPGI